jgi:hypothetical protein
MFQKNRKKKEKGTPMPKENREQEHNTNLRMSLHESKGRTHFS